MNLVRVVVLPVASFLAACIGAIVGFAAAAYSAQKVKALEPLVPFVGLAGFVGAGACVGFAILRATERADERRRARVQAAVILDFALSPEDATERAGEIAPAASVVAEPAPAEETPREATYRLARSPAPLQKQSSMLVFALTLAAFVVTSGETSLRGTAVLVAVLVFHELGHFAAMTAFGYQNPRIFFLPLFGAAASGRKEGVPGWQEVIVLLAGPLPGLVAGTVLLATSAAPQGTVARTFATTLVWIKAFNLLPLEALDGGRVLNRLFFSRHPLIEAVCAALMSIAMGVFGYWAKTPILVIVGGLGLVRLAPSLSLSRGAAELRPRWPDLGALSAAPEPYLDELHTVALGHLSQNARRPETVAGWMRSVHERVVARPVHFIITTVLMGAYVASVALGLVGVVLAVSKV